MARLVICSDCGEKRELYAKGLCLACYVRHWYVRHWLEKNPDYMHRYSAVSREEERLAYQRRYEEYREVMRVYSLARENDMVAPREHCYNQGHREGKAARLRRWQQENPDKMAAYQRRWRQANPEKRSAQQARRRARKRGVADTLTPKQLEFERRIGEATYPGKALHLHHLVPLGKGNHSWGNVMFIPASLNSIIGDRLPEEVYSQLAFKGG